MSLEQIGIDSPQFRWAISNNKNKLITVSPYTRSKAACVRSAKAFLANMKPSSIELKI